VAASSSIRIGQRSVGAGHPCFVIAEVGINHNGEMSLAQKMIELAAKAGADAVKFQNYRTEDFISDKSLTHSYRSCGAEVIESQWDMFKRCELDPDNLKNLAETCRKNKVAFISTPTGPDGIDALVRAGAAAVKNGSDYLSNLPLIRHMARSGLPTIISTGMATLAEIDEAARSFAEAGGTELAVLHCVSNYPATAATLHLHKIEAMQRALQRPIGFSDHTEGAVAAIASVTLGACILEKHFTADKGLPGPDQAMSADPSEFESYVRAARDTEAALAEAAVGPSAAEVNSRRDWRLSCVAARDLPKDHHMSESDIAFHRPGSGLKPADAQFLIGRKLAQPVSRGHVFALKDFR